MSRNPFLLQRLKDRGFDRSTKVRGGYYRPACSQCEALVINGVACHETGCPNARAARSNDDEEDE